MANRSNELKNLIKKWACLKFAIPECLQAAQQTFINQQIRWQKFKTQSTLEEDRITFCSVIRYGFEVEWNLVFDMLHGDDMLYNAMLIEALGCSREPAILRVYLGFLRNSTMSPYFPNIIKALAENDVAKCIALEHVFEDIEYFLDHIGIAELTPLLRKISTEVEYNMVSKLASETLQII